MVMESYFEDVHAQDNWQCYSIQYRKHLEQTKYSVLLHLAIP